jgi:hypothetical protein
LPVAGCRLPVARQNRRDGPGRLFGEWRARCRRYGCFVTGLFVTGLIASQAFRTDPAPAWERDDMLKKVKKISLRVPFEPACLAAKAWQVFKRENYFRQYIFNFAGSIKTGG